jgi:hypothetical protein
MTSAGCALETYTHLIRAVASAAARQALETLMTTTFKDDFIDRIKAEGRAEGKADTVLRILTARGFNIPGLVRDRVLSCSDLAQLDRWADTAVTAASLEDIFAGDQ